MSRIFFSHSSKDDEWAIALKDWLVRESWSAPDDIFLDLDPDRGIAAGQRWVTALEDVATRCEAVLFLVSEGWLDSKWCRDEYQLANRLNKKLFALLVDDVTFDRLPGGLAAQWQVVRLKGDPAERFVSVHPLTGKQSPVHIAQAALTSLKRGLDQAGIGPNTFQLLPDPQGPFGWRAPYRGLEALEPEDAAVFFGRSADIVRGIDTLRGLALRKAPRLIVILGSSGAGKSSFLRAGLWPRLLRDDSQWLPLRPIRAGRGGAIEGSEGLLDALEDVQRRFGLHEGRAELRDQVGNDESFVALLSTLREQAAKRALISRPPFPLPVICLDQGEEVFNASAAAENEKFLHLVRGAIDRDVALLLVTIRSDSYGAMQGSTALAGIDQLPISLGPIPNGEIAQIIREPAEILRRKAGPQAPVFDAAVIERLQGEIEGEDDAMPLLAFVLQRLMREYRGSASIGLRQLERTGGVAAAIESAAETALADAGFTVDRRQQRTVLRRLFIPRLARIDRESKSPQRRVARQNEIPADLVPLAQALTQRRLLVIKVAGQSDAGATLEVAHEALLRRWPTLADLLAEDLDALLLLDGVLSAAADWDQATSELKSDFLAHRGSRLSDASAIASRGEDWERSIAPARAYLAACVSRETTEREERETALAREQARLAEIAAAQEQIEAGQERTARTQRTARRTLIAMAAAILVGVILAGMEYRGLKASLDFGTENLLAEASAVESLNGNYDGALRLAVLANDPAGAALADAISQAAWTVNLNGHTDWVLHAAYSSDGTRIVTASKDKTARIWDASSGQPIRIISGHTDAVTFASFSPDGKRIVTASQDKTVRIWDAATGTQLFLLQHDAPVSSAAFSPDGQWVVTASQDKAVRVWDATTGALLKTLTGHQGAVTSAAFSPDGHLIVSTSADNTARIWDTTTWSTTQTLIGHEATVWSASFSPDGKSVVTASDDTTARIWDVSTGKEQRKLKGHVDWVRSASFSADGTHVVTASYDDTIRIWDAHAADDSTPRVLRGHEAYVESAAFSPDGSKIVSASDDLTARVWDTTESGDAVVLVGHDDDVSSGIYNADGTRIVTSSDDGTAREWDPTTGKEIQPQINANKAYLFSAAFSPDGKKIVTGSYDDTARIWDSVTGAQLTAPLEANGYVESAFFSPDGTRIVTAADDDNARVWDAVTGTELLTLHGHDSYLDSAAYSPDGKYIVTASDDETARIWDATSGAYLRSLKGHESYIESAYYSPDGKRIVTASYDHTARVWDAQTGETTLILRGHTDSVRSAAFSPDGTRVVTASADQTVRVWDAITGNTIAVLRGHGDVVNSAFFSPDGTHIISASNDKTARIWDARFPLKSTTKLREQACKQELGHLTHLTREEMHIAGKPDTASLIDVCAGLD